MLLDEPVETVCRDLTLLSGPCGCWGGGGGWQERWVGEKRGGGGWEGREGVRWEGGEREGGRRGRKERGEVGVGGGRRRGERRGWIGDWNSQCRRVWCVPYPQRTQGSKERPYLRFQSIVLRNSEPLPFRTFQGACSPTFKELVPEFPRPVNHNVLGKLQVESHIHNPLTPVENTSH